MPAENLASVLVGSILGTLLPCIKSKSLTNAKYLADQYELPNKYVY